MWLKALGARQAATDRHRCSQRGHPAQAVLLAIIAYARRAGAYVIAEGIESEQILTFVRNADELHDLNDPSIKGGQGYLLPTVRGRVTADRLAAVEASGACKPLTGRGRPRSCGEGCP